MLESCCPSPFTLQEPFEGDPYGECLWYKTCDEEIVAPPQFIAGPIRSEVSEDNPLCIEQYVKVWVDCVDEEPACLANLYKKQWSVRKKSLRPDYRSLYLLLKRVALDCCADTVDIVPASNNCDCDEVEELTPSFTDVRTATTHIKSEKESRQGAEWCFDYRRFCFDRCDLGLAPGVRILWCGKYYAIQKIVNHGHPHGLIEVEARG